MKQIGITGGMGSGKSWITKVFAQWRVPVYDADSRAKYVMQHDALLKIQLKEYFG
ncbi:MAG: dephospho-CoA kinase [Sphingobacteriales bacterium]|nr:dephospho-CoA kinase [Sphingobacteriales bacterium]